MEGLKPQFSAIFVEFSTCFFGKSQIMPRLAEFGINRALKSPLIAPIGRQIFPDMG
jgi:hypothetical protein